MEANKLWVPSLENKTRNDFIRNSQILRFQIGLFCTKTSRQDGRAYACCGSYRAARSHALDTWRNHGETRAAANFFWAPAPVATNETGTSTQTHGFRDRYQSRFLSWQFGATILHWHRRLYYPSPTISAGTFQKLLFLFRNMPIYGFKGHNITK